MPEPHKNIESDSSRSPEKSTPGAFARFSVPISAALDVVAAIADIRGALPTRFLTPLAFFCIFVTLLALISLVTWSQTRYRATSIIAAIAVPVSLGWPAYQLWNQGRSNLEDASYVTIDSDLEGVKVASEIDLRGRMNQLGNGRVWVLVHPEDGDFIYPQGHCDVDAGKTIWKCSHTKIGDSSSAPGLSFQITAVIVSPKDSDKFETYVTNGFQEDGSPADILRRSVPITIIRE